MDCGSADNQERPILVNLSFLQRFVACSFAAGLDLVRAERDTNVTHISRARRAGSGADPDRHLGVRSVSDISISFAPPLANNRMNHMSTKTHPGGEHHENAAEHHENAAHHHREAAKHYEGGDHEKAGHHAHVAHAHGLHAAHHAQEAAKHHAEHHGEHDAEDDE
jgi:hypothetical protein